MHWQPALPTPEEAYNFCMQVWESDSEQKEKKVKEKRAAASESPEAAGAVDSTEPAEPAEVSCCSLLPLFVSVAKTGSRVLLTS